MKHERETMFKSINESLLRKHKKMYEDYDEVDVKDIQLEKYKSKKELLTSPDRKRLYRSQ